MLIENWTREGNVLEGLIRFELLEIVNAVLSSLLVSLYSTLKKLYDVMNLTIDMDNVIILYRYVRQLDHF